MPRPMPVWHLEPPTASSRVLVFSGNDLICPDSVTDEPVFRLDEAEAIGALESAPLLVAHWRGADIYAAGLKESPKDLPSRSLRSILTHGSADFAGLASTAVQLLHWQRDHRFCGRCGSATELRPTERASFCRGCEHHFFPRLSPCVIVAIRRDDQVLLAQSQRYAGQFYSLIAGFIEPGESAEEAVHREVEEETGLQVQNLRYMESQSWAFPHQLMLGYIADYRGGELVLQKEELAAADWFDADSLPPVPGDWTIAGKLIRAALKPDEDATR